MSGSETENEDMRNTCNSSEDEFIDDYIDSELEDESNHANCYLDASLGSSSNTQEDPAVSFVAHSHTQSNNYLDIKLPNGEYDLKKVDLHFLYAVNFSGEDKKFSTVFPGLSLY